MTRRTASLQGDVLAAAARMGTFTKAELRRILTGKYPSSVDRTVDNLFRKGHLERVDGNHGVYRLAENPPRPKAPEAQDRMWRVIKVRASYALGITARELQALAEIGRTYARGYLTFLRKKGLIKQVGKAKHPDGVHRSPVYGLTGEGRAFKGTPHNRKAKRIEAAELRRRELFDLGCQLAAILREEEPGVMEANCIMAKIRELTNVPRA